MQKDDLVHIRHILDASRKTIAFAQGKTRDDLDDNEKLALSLIRLLEIIGEAANALSEEFRKQYSDIPWQKIISMRNKLIHAYFDIDLNIVWDTVANDLTPLIEKLEKIVSLEENRKE